MLYTCFTPTAPGKWTVEGTNGLIAAVTVGKQCAIVPTHKLSSIERVTLAVWMREQCPNKQASGTCSNCANLC